MKELELLKKARAIIADRSNWIKGYVANNADNREVPPLDPSATCFCTIGAVYKAADIVFLDVSRKYPGSNTGDPAVVISELTDTIQAFEEAEDYWGVAEFNDNEKTTHDDVLRVIDKTIERMSMGVV